MRIKLDLPLDLSEIKEAVGCYASNTSNARIEYITTDTRELMPGDLVFRHNGQRIHHVGVFVGNGLVIESKGRDDGVVLRLMDASGKSYWNRYGRLGVITDDESRPEQETPYYPDMYCYSGATYVNLRTEPNGEIIGRVNKGDNVLVLNDRDGWAEVIKKESRYLRGWCASGRLKKA